MTTEPSAPPRTTARTRLAVLLGHPVAHSVSPQIHSAAFAATGIDAVYVALDVAQHDLRAVVAGLRAAGVLGVNVTVPHKRAVLDMVDERTEEVAAVGAANTLFWRDGDLVADNTDARGLEASVRAEIAPPPGAAILLFGAGGAARAAAVAFARLGCAVTVRARREDAAAEVAALARAHGARDPQPGRRPDVVVNATPLGLRGEQLPDDLLALGPGQVALDLIYRPTPFLRTAAERGARAVDGLGMLVGQAAAAFERWTAHPAPHAAMRTAAQAAVGD